MLVFLRSASEFIASLDRGLPISRVRVQGNGFMMIIHTDKPLFTRDCVEGSPSLQIIRDLFAMLLVGKLLKLLWFARGKGRND